MEKIKLELSKRDFITKSFAGQEIKIQPYIELDDLIALVDASFESLIEEKENKLEVLDTYDKIIAINRINIYILKNYTNIDINAIDVEILTTSGIDDYVCKYITHYNMAKEMLLQLVNEYNQNLTLLNMFSNIPDVNELVGENSKFVEQLNSIDESKLKMVTNEMMYEIAKKNVKNEKQSEKIIKDVVDKATNNSLNS